MQRKILISLVVVFTFIVLRYIKYLFRYCIFGVESWYAMDDQLRICILNYTQIFIVLIVTALLFRKLPFEILGLKKDLLRGLLMAFLFTVPMFVGYGYKVGFQADLTWSRLHADMVLAGFFEEFLFRGFVFGILFYYGGLGFISAVLIPSVFFGIAHLYQADSATEGLSIFLFTTLASAGFAWFYVAWKSLWMVIFLHGFMDLAWGIFAVESNVTGNSYENVFRFVTLGLAIYFSIRKAKADNNYSLKDKLWLNKKGGA